MKPFIAIILVALVLTGCGTRLVYPNLDWLIPWYLDNYMALDSRQKSDVKKVVSRHLNWHCGTQLDIYAKFLHEFSREVGDANHPITFSSMNQRWDELQGFWKKLMTKISPDVADLLLNLSDSQIDAMFTRLEKRNRELAAKHVDIDRDLIESKRRKYMLKNTKRWISQLTPEQKQLVTEWSRLWKPTEVDWMTHRRDIQNEYRKLLSRRNEESYFRDRIFDLLVNRERYRSAAYQQKIEFNTHLTIGLMLDIDRQLSNAQRKHLQKKLASLARDFEHLSCDPRRKAPQSPVKNISSSPPS